MVITLLDEVAVNNMETPAWIYESPSALRAEAPAIPLVRTSTASAPKSARLKIVACEYMTSDSITLEPKIVAGEINPSFFESEVKVRILQSPKHGKLSPVGRKYPESDFYYDPSFTYDKEGNKVYYAGKDTFAFSVSGGGVTVQVHYVVGVDVGQPASFINDSGDRQSSDGWSRYCGDGKKGKVSSATLPDSSFADLAVLERNIVLSGLIAEASKRTSLNVDLPSNAVAQTSGEGLRAEINLDTDAAGHGWFIDPTPLDKSEFLPTADPTVFTFVIFGGKSYVRRLTY